jgi:ATP-dependent DNA helicase RecQ
VLRGAKSERIVKFGHDQIPTHGVGRGRTKEDWMTVGRQLIQAGYLLQNQERFGAIQVTAQGRQVLSGKERVTLVSRSRVTSPRPEHLQANPELFEELRALRKQVADERGVPPYVIFHDRTLQEMAGRLPASIDELLRLPGVGTAKARTFGTRFLDMVRRYALNHELAAPTSVDHQRIPARDTRRGRPVAGSSMRETLEMFQSGKTVADIARDRGLALSTIESHLAQALEAGEEIDVDRLLPSDRLHVINEVLRTAGDVTLTEIQNQLGEEFSFTEIRMARALSRYE